MEYSRSFVIMKFVIAKFVIAKFVIKKFVIVNSRNTASGSITFCARGLADKDQIMRKTSGLAESGLRFQLCFCYCQTCTKNYKKTRPRAV